MKSVFESAILSFRNKGLLMAIILCLLFSASGLMAQSEISPVASENMGKWTLVIHGGAGGGAKGSISPEKEQAYLEKLDEALGIGAGILSKGGSSLDAVEAVVKFMEDCPMFNAGKGAVLNEDGVAELDASIMDGLTGKAGAVAAVTTVKNPVVAARKVMEKTKHVMLACSGAERFAQAQKLDIVEPSYFITPDRLDAWKKAHPGKAVDPGNDRKHKDTPSPSKPEKNDGNHGTVGAVAFDIKGNLAAATSTGGLMGKMTGRVGDSPVIGAGTWADNKSCAVSCTGQGEFFIRNVVAYDVSALMHYRGIALEDAANSVVMEKLKSQGADGGLIAVDRDGNIAMPFNTNAMFRGFTKSTGEKATAIY